MKLYIDQVRKFSDEAYRARDDLRADLRAGAIVATDRAAKAGAAALKSRIRSVGLGRLSGAVGWTSSKVKGLASGSDPYGVIYARGGDESLAGGALESYSRGATITAKGGRWLAFPTKAIPRKIGRYRTTPSRYNASGLATSIGALQFVPKGPDRAELIIKNVTLSAKTGRARRAGKRPSKVRINEKVIVAFTLIRVTRRAERFDKDAEIVAQSRRVPDYMVDAMREIQRVRANR